jgi:Cellulose binding domain/Dienelactone hydrolase family
MPQREPRLGTPAGDQTGRRRRRLTGRGMRWTVALAAAALALSSAVLAIRPAAASDNPYQRGPDPTLASVAATRGTFATAQVSVPPGNGFNGGVIYYPTDTSQGTFGAIGIMPGYTAKFAVEEAWMGPWLASFGFVVIGVETNSPNDFDTARGTELLAALDYLTQKSSVRSRVDPNRLSVVGHSMGGGGAMVAAVNRPSLKAAIGLAPFMPSGNLATDHVPTLLVAGQSDTTVTTSMVTTLYNSAPAATEKGYMEFAGAGHGFYTSPNNRTTRVMIPWFKIFVDNDTRYSQFLCPLADTSGIPVYRNTCPFVATGFPSSSPTTGSPSASPSGSPTSAPPSSVPPSSVPPSSVPPSSAAPGGACTASYRTVNAWPGGFQGEVTVTAGSSAVNGWTVGWPLANGQSITQVWNGTLSTSGSSVSVRNASYNGSLLAAGSTTFGFLGTGTPSNPTLTCTSP